MTFERFMELQVAAMLESGEGEAEWVEAHAEEFRVSHPVDEIDEGE